MHFRQEAPIGLTLTRSARQVERAFDDALASMGSTRPTWLILMALKTSPPATQIELAESVGIRSATLSHHLNAMEKDGLITRIRRPENRRVHEVALTDLGGELFLRLAEAARSHDRRLRAGLTTADEADLRRILALLTDNIGG